MRGIQVMRQVQDKKVSKSRISQNWQWAELEDKKTRGESESKIP